MNEEMLGRINISKRNMIQRGMNPDLILCSNKTLKEIAELSDTLLGHDGSLKIFNMKVVAIDHFDKEDRVILIDTHAEWSNLQVDDDEEVLA